MIRLSFSVVHTSCFSSNCFIAYQNKRHTFNLLNIQRDFHYSVKLIFSLVRTTTLGQSVYPDIVLHIKNYYNYMMFIGNLLSFL
jgi:hypothetical protein